MTVMKLHTPGSRCWTFLGIGWPYLGSILSGIFAGLAFPLPGWSGLAWLAPGVLLCSALGSDGAKVFRIGYLAGLIQYLISLRWLLLIPFPSGAVAGWLALSAYSALFWGLALWSSLSLVRFFTSGKTTQGWSDQSRHLCGLSWFRRSTIWFLMAAIFTGCEVLRGRLLTGFPWNFYGITQWQNIALIQISSITGVFGVSFLIHWVSFGLLGACLHLKDAARSRLAWTSDLRVPLVGLLLVLGWGFQRVMQPVPKGTDVSIALVQPSIPQTLIWDDAANPERFAKVFALTQTAIGLRPEAVVWPEGSLPDITPEQFNQIVRLLGPSESWWLFGTGYGRLVDGHPQHYNAGLLVDSLGNVRDRYHKRRLVIFGEYIPFEHTLPFMKWLTPIGSSFTPGTNASAFRIGRDTNTVVSPVICFEDMFPETTRSHVAPDTDFLLELTNDGWFGESSAQWQHCAGAAFRSVENGIPLVRCANNGLTCWLDEYGRMRDLLGRGSDVHAPGVLLIQLPRRAEGFLRPLTWYHEHGDVFGWGCVMVFVFGGVHGVWVGRSEKQKRRSQAATPMG